MLLKAIAILCLIITYHTVALANVETLPQRSASDILREAEDYIIVEASRALELLSQPYDLSTLTAAQSVRWHLTKMRAAIATNKLTGIENEIQALFNLKQHQYFQDNAMEAFRISGIVLRKLGHLKRAQQSYQCALLLTNTDKERIGLLINQAVLARHLENHPQAKLYYKQAETLALRLNNKRALATIYNNLGTLELDMGYLDRAEEYYRNALSGFQETNKRSGIITAGTNLLLIFSIQKNTLNFQRLIGPMTTYIENYPDSTKKALLTWLVAANNVNKGEVIDEKTKGVLINGFHQLETLKLQALVNNYLAPKFDLSFEISATPQRLTPPDLVWFHKLERCFDIVN
ncbi:hypothetical protein ACSLBF_20425 (plasmid) [Pseudoalteromonas sp. T1lg65]|uniref:hypothetical protein n=1 Tax=Pseudoalteromonas sp. T1lg65 TaxID=2077101 RepID=UPI003F7913FE